MLISVNNGEKPTVNDLNARGIYNVCCAAVYHAVNENYHVKKHTPLIDLVKEHERRVEFLANGKITRMVVDIMEYDFDKFLRAALRKEDLMFGKGMRALKARDDREAARLFYDPVSAKKVVPIDPLSIETYKLHILKRRQADFYNALREKGEKSGEFAKKKMKHFENLVENQLKKVKSLKKQSNLKK